MEHSEKPSDNINTAYEARTAAVQAASRQLYEALVKNGVNHEIAAPAITLVESTIVALTEIAATQMHLTGIAYSEEQRINAAKEKAEQEKVNPTRNYIGKPR